MSALCTAAGDRSRGPPLLRRQRRRGPVRFVALPDNGDVVVRDHESDSRQWVANSLHDYLWRRAAGQGDDWFRGIA